MAVGAENNIALVPVGVLIASAIGCSRLVGVTMAVGGIAIGFALSPINPTPWGWHRALANCRCFPAGGCAP